MRKLRAALKPWAHSHLFPLVETAWAGLFRLAGAILRPRASEWSSASGETALVIAPHPDDETLGCGGIIALHLQRGDRVRVLVVTDGGSSGAGGLGREEIARLRGGELAEAVTRLGGVELTQLALPEGGWTHAQLVGHLTQALAEVRPSVVYTTSCVDFHPEHRHVAFALADALSAAPEVVSCRAVRAYEVQVPLTPLLANVIADTSGVAHIKRHALQAYATQLPALAWVTRLARYERALHRRKGDIEVFWQMSPTHFCTVMARERNRAGEKARYRSLRLRPFSDGLAWVVGMRARWRLRCTS